MKATRPTAFIKTQMQWYVELVATDMFWCDLLVDEAFSAPVGIYNPFVLDYRKNFKNKMTHAFEGQCVYLLCRREKVRFDVKNRPRYNFITKKTKFHLLIGMDSRKMSVCVDLMKTFFLEKSNCKVIVDPKFITLLSDQRNKLTLSIHDFMSSIDLHLGLESEVLAAECTCSPYQEPSNRLNAFQNEMALYGDKGSDLLVYVNKYDIILNIRNLHVVGDRRSGYDLENPSNSLFLMLARSFSLYFFGDERTSSLAVKNAKENLSRFALRNQNFLIKISHFYDCDKDYTRLKSKNVSSTAKHAFTVLCQNKELVVFHGEISS